MNLRIKNIDFLSYLSIIALSLNVPFIFWYLFGSIYPIISFFAIFILLIFTLLFFSNKKIKLDKYDVFWISCWFTLVISFFIYSLLMIVIHEDFLELRKFYGLLIKFIFLFCVTIIIKHSLISYVNKIMLLNNIVLFLSIILFFVLAFGIDVPSFSFEKADHLSHRVFWIGATNAVFYWGDNILIRIAGFADEPGAYALIITYLIIINEFTLNSSKLRTILIVGGFFTFSLAFIISLFGFIIYWFLKGYLKVKLIISTLLIIVALILISRMSFAEPISKMTLKFISRFEKGPDGKIRGDNRTSAWPIQTNEFLKHPILGIGINPEGMKRINSGQNSIFVFLAIHGIWGAIFNFLPFYALLLINYRKPELLLLLILLMNFIQRPGIEDTFSMMALTILYYSSVTRNFILNRNIWKPKKLKVVTEV